MNASWALRTGTAFMVVALAVMAGLVDTGQAVSSSSTARVAGSVETQIRVNGFSAVGRTIIGHGTAITTVREVNGRTAVKRTPLRFKVRSGSKRLQQTAPCHILFLELEELDLTLLGLRVFLRSAVPDQPITLRVEARREGGILGRLFCNLSEAVPATTANKVATQLNAQMKGAKIMQAKMTLFAPNAGAGSAKSSFQPAQAPELCAVAHIVLGPIHLDLLGLIVDLSKLEVDIWGVPGTVIGDLFCQLNDAGGGGS